jgi:cellulose biosynthesis protein BcsQ
MTDEANVFEALRMGKLVDNVAKLANRPIPSHALLTRVKRASVAAHSRAQLETLQARPLTSFLSDRAVFQESSFHGSSPVALEPRGQATREIKALAAEVWAIIAPKGG